MKNGVFLIGTSLIVANGFSSGQFKDIASNASTGTANQTLQIGGQQAMLMITGELIFVIVLASMAEASDGANATAIALLLGLWLIWLMHNAGNAQGIVQLFQGKFTPNVAAKSAQ